jgi:hypothetical protein
MLLTATITVRENQRCLAARLRDLAGALAAAAMLLLAAAGLFLSWQSPLAHRLSTHMQSSDAAYLGLFVSGFWSGRQAHLILAIAAASIIALIAWLRGNPKAVAAAVALASMAGVSLWSGILRPGLAARRTLKAFAGQMRMVTGGQPVYTPDGPDYEVAYYYGAAVRPLGWRPHGRRDSQPYYLLVWSDQLTQREDGGVRQEVLASRPALDGRRLVLLKVDAIRFESSPEHY